MITKIFYTLLICVSSLSVHSQVFLSGKVLDKQTEEPIAYVHIYDSNLGIGTTTNIKGEFNLKQPDSIKSIILTFSHIGYKAYETAVKFTDNKSYVIKLAPNLIRLDEVTISPKNALEIIRKCINLRTSNYPNSGFMATGFQREIIRSNNEYVQLVESEYESYYENGSVSTTLIDGRFAENKPFRINDNLWNDKRGGFYVFGLTALGDLNIPFQYTVLGIELEDINQLPNYYDFEFAGTTELESGEVFIIRFDQKKNIKKSLIKGALYIDSKTYALVELTYQLSDEGKKFIRMNQRWNGQIVSTAPFSKKVKILDESRHIKYRPFKGKWYLSSIIQDIRFTAALKLPLKTIAKSSLLELHTEQVVSNIELDVRKVSKNDNPTDMYYYQTYLKNNYENYQIAQWNKLRTIKSDIDYAEIVDRLKRANAAIN